MTLNRPFLRLLASSLIAAAFSVQAALADPTALISAAKAELTAGNAEAAYSALQAEEAQYAGDIEFDYWFGLAANRAGKSGRALFALERVLAQQPNHAAARLELAVAYARLNLTDAARRELDILETQNPPKTAQAAIDELRSQLGLGDKARDMKKRLAYVTLEAGYDDNPGSWPKDFGPFANIDPPASPYGGLSAGLRQRKDLSGNQYLQFSLNGMARRHTETSNNPNDDASQFDQDFLGGRVEWAHDRNGRAELALAADVGYFGLDGERYYNYVGLETEWREQVSDSSRVLLTLSSRSMQFENDIYDNQHTRLRLGARHQLNRSWRLEVDVTAEYEAADGDRPGGDAIRASLRGAAWFQMQSRQRVGADLTLSRTEFNKPFTGDDRSDDRLVAGLNWEKSFSGFWQLRARAQYRDQDSSAPVYVYDQTSGSVALTRYF